MVFRSSSPAPLLSASSGFVTVSTSPDIRIFYTINSGLASPPSRPIIVLSNSLAASTPLWDDFVAAFSSTYTIIRYDARFHGQSPLSADEDFDYEKGHSLEDLAADVVKLLDAVGLTEGHVVEAFIGLSIGAGVGVILAAQYPERFKNFIIVGTKAKAGDDDSGAFDRRIEYAREHGVAAQARQSVERWFDSRWLVANPEQAATVEAMVGSQNLPGFIASAAGLRRLDLWPHAEMVKERHHGYKLLFVVGERDAPLVVEDTKKLAHKVGSEVVVVQGAGHIVNIQDPEQFHQLIKRKLS